MRDILHRNVEKYENFYGHFTLYRFCFEIFYRSRYTKKIIDKYNSDAKNVLDIGFGSGETLKLLKKSNIYGIELSSKSVYNLLKVLPHAKVYFQNLDDNFKLKYQDNFFDVVILLHILEHINKYKQLLREVYRVSSEKSIIIIAIPINQSENDESHIRKFTEEELITFLRRIKFKIILTEKNLFIPELPAVFNYKNKKINIFSLWLNIILSLNYRILILIDKIMSLFTKPRQIFIVCQKGGK